MCKHLRLILSRFFTWVIAFLKKLHKRQGKHQGCGKTHDRYRKEDNCLKIPEILEEGGREVWQEIRVDFSTVEGKENGKYDGGDKTDGNACHKSFFIGKPPAQFKFVILDRLINPEPGDYPIEKAVKNIGMKVKKGKYQKIGDQAAAGGNAKSHGKCKSHHGCRMISFL